MLFLKRNRSEKLAWGLWKWWCLSPWLTLKTYGVKLLVCLFVSVMCTVTFHCFHVLIYIIHYLQFVSSTSVPVAAGQAAVCLSYCFPFVIPYVFRKRPQIYTALLRSGQSMSAPDWTEGKGSREWLWTSLHLSEFFSFGS